MTSTYDWRNLPEIPSYPADEKPSLVQQRLHYIWPSVLAIGVFILNLNFKPSAWWWWSIWLIMFAFLWQRAFRINTSLPMRIVLGIFALGYAFGTFCWLSIGYFVFSSVHDPVSSWGSNTWFLLQPASLAVLTILLNRQSGLILWWWRWAWPVVLIVFLCLISLFAGIFFRR